MEEQFFFHYHMSMSRAEFMSYPILERRWMSERFIEQKQKEHESMEKAKKKKN